MVPENPGELMTGPDMTVGDPNLDEPEPVCGACAFCRAFPAKGDEEPTRGICYGLPPSTFWARGMSDDGEALDERPSVALADPACSLFFYLRKIAQRLAEIELHHSSELRIFGLETGGDLPNERQLTIAEQLGADVPRDVPIPD